MEVSWPMAVPRTNLEVRGRGSPHPLPMPRPQIRDKETVVTEVTAAGEGTEVVVIRIVVGKIPATRQATGLRAAADQGLRKVVSVLGKTVSEFRSTPILTFTAWVRIGSLQTHSPLRMT